VNDDTQSLGDLLFQCLAMEALPHNDLVRLTRGQILPAGDNIEMIDVVRIDERRATNFRKIGIGGNSSLKGYLDGVFGNTQIVIFSIWSWSWMSVRLMGLAVWKKIVER
jgi:hypothetical protein